MDLILPMDPFDEVAKANLAYVVAGDDARLQEAIDLVSDALALSPKMSRAWEMKGLFHDRDGSYVEAAKSFVSRGDPMFDSCLDLCSNFFQMNRLLEPFPTSTQSDKQQQCWFAT